MVLKAVYRLKLEWVHVERVTIPDSTREVGVSVSLTYSDLEGHFCCLKPFYLTYLAGAAKGNEKWGSKRGRLRRAREREPITGVWGRRPQRGAGAEPLVRGQGAKPPEAEKLFCF